jgi:hypothetical protein
LVGTGAVGFVTLEGDAVEGEGTCKWLVAGTGTVFLGVVIFVSFFFVGEGYTLVNYCPNTLKHI